MSSALVLVVEDDALVRKLVQVTLQTEGYRVVAAETAARALALAAAEPPDLILLDLTLPDMGGLDLAERLRSLSHLADVPLIAFSGLARGAEQEPGRRAQLTDYLLKPVEPSTLLAALHRHLVAAGSR